MTTAGIPATSRFLFVPGFLFAFQFGRGLESDDADDGHRRDDVHLHCDERRRIGVGSITVKRDATPPVGFIWGPPYAEFLHQKHTLYATDYGCGDSMSGIASCMGPVPDGGWLPTSVPGRFSFDVQARDRAGNTGIISRPNHVSTNACSPRPPGLVGRWPGDGASREIIARNDGSFVTTNSDHTLRPGTVWGSVFVQAATCGCPTSRRCAWTMRSRCRRGSTRFATGWAHTPSSRAAKAEYLLARGPNGNIHYSIAKIQPGPALVRQRRSDGSRETERKLDIEHTTAARSSCIRTAAAYTRAASGVIGDAAPFQNASQVAARQERHPAATSTAISTTWSSSIAPCRTPIDLLLPPTSAGSAGSAC